MIGAFLKESAVVVIFEVFALELAFIGLTLKSEIAVLVPSLVDAMLNSFVVDDLRGLIAIGVPFDAFPMFAVVDVISLPFVGSVFVPAVGSSVAQKSLHRQNSLNPAILVVLGDGPDALGVLLD